MKKITLLGALLISAISFGQEVEISGIVENQVIEIDVPVAVTASYSGFSGGVAGGDSAIAIGIYEDAVKDEETGVWGPTDGLIKRYNIAFTGDAAASSYTFEFLGDESGWYAYNSLIDGLGGNTEYDYATSPVTINSNVEMVNSSALPAGQAYFASIYACTPDYSSCPTTIIPVCIGDDCEPVASTAEFNELAGSVYPNPATDVVYFGNDVETETYKVMSISGALVKEAAATGSLDVSDLAPGLYLLVTDAGTARLIKQ